MVERPEHQGTLPGTGSTRRGYGVVGASGFARRVEPVAPGAILDDVSAVIHLTERVPGFTLAVPEAVQS